MRHTIWLSALLLVACKTTLGPTPAVTGASAVPAARAGIETQVGVVPGHFISTAVAEEAQGSSHPQLAAIVDLGDTAPGLAFGGRLIGESGDTQGEPILGYRRDVTERVAAAGFLSGARGAAEERSASYEATRVHVEAALDVQVTRPSRWVELHAVGGAAATYLSAEGTYCADEQMQFGTDCPEPPEAPVRVMAASASGIYPSANVGLALHVARHRAGHFHGARVLALFAAGAMPKVVAGRDEGMQRYAAIGLALSFAVGAR